MRPEQEPIGLHLARTARVVARAFDAALADAGGSLPVWLVLLNLTIEPTANQRELAAAVGVTEATLTHHLNAMEAGGLLTRARAEHNRRVHVVTLTAAGKEAFKRLSRAAQAFDSRLRSELTDAQLGELRLGLERLTAGAST